jgi:hypothetical protein
MKDIKDMNLAELADQIERKLDVPMGEDLVQYDIADRLYAIHDLTRWIPVSERLPTREDADAEGYVWVSAIQITMGDRANDSWLWSEVSLDGGIAYKPTHWKRITPPEAP